MIEFECPHCSHRMKAQLAAAGIRSKCPRCKANVTVPMPEHLDPIRHSPELEPDEFIEPDEAPVKTVRRQEARHQAYVNPNIFRNPANGYQVDVSLAWLWVLLFGAIYFAVKGVWTHFIGGILLGMVTFGLAWLVYPFYACRIMRNHYLSMGWTEAGPAVPVSAVPQFEPKKWLKPALIAFACVFGFCLISSIIGAFLSDGGTYSDLADLEESEAKSKELNEEMKQITDRRINKKLDSIMSGSSPESTKTDANRLKKWMVPGDFIISAELWEKDGEHNIVHKMNDGSDWVQRVSIFGQKLLPDQSEYPGEYYLINQNGDLESWDQDGKVSTSIPLR